MKPLHAVCDVLFGGNENGKSADDLVVLRFRQLHRRYVAGFRVSQQQCVYHCLCDCRCGSKHRYPGKPARKYHCERGNSEGERKLHRRIIIGVGVGKKPAHVRAYHLAKTGAGVLRGDEVFRREPALVDIRRLRTSGGVGAQHRLRLFVADRILRVRGIAQAHRVQQPVDMLRVNIGGGIDDIPFLPVPGGFQYRTEPDLPHKRHHIRVVKHVRVREQSLVNALGGKFVGIGKGMGYQRKTSGAVYLVIRYLTDKRGYLGTETMSALRFEALSELPQPFSVNVKLSVFHLSISFFLSRRMDIIDRNAIIYC